jgi:hypothetical protein
MVMLLVTKSFTLSLATVNAPANIAAHFEVEVNTINYHIKEILKSREQKEATIRNFRIVQIEGKRQVERDVEFYNLEMIFAVGNSFQP